MPKASSNRWLQLVLGIIVMMTISSPQYVWTLAFLLEALAITLLLVFRSNAAAFVVLSGLVFFGWGEIFSLVPSTLTDTFGTGNATTRMPVSMRRYYSTQEVEKSTGSCCNSARCAAPVVAC